MEADDMTSDAGPPVPALAADDTDTPEEAERMDRQRDASFQLLASTSSSTIRRACPYSFGTSHTASGHAEAPG